LTAVALITRVLAVTGRPGAGKSTALIRLAQRYPMLARFGVRDYGLALAEAGDPLGLRMREMLLRGELLPNDLVREEFGHFLSRLPRPVAALAVEGYPRDIEQCEDFIAAVTKAGALAAGLVVVDIPEEVARDRVLCRSICTQCGLPAPSADFRICPACQAPFAVRQDDADERLERRLRDFRTVSAGVRNHFEKLRRLYVVDGCQEPDGVCGRLLALLLPDEAAGSAEMMIARRAAMDAMGQDIRFAAAARWTAADLTVDATPYLEARDRGQDLSWLADRVANRLIRDDGAAGVGVTVVTGLSAFLDVTAARAFHEALFRHVWDRVRERALTDLPTDRFKIKIGVTADGDIPLALYGSRWSFKQLHADRDALLFSHLYGPTAGFTGGDLVLADIRTYLSRHTASFEDVFGWSEEPTPGSKPVVLPEHEAAVLAEYGFILESPDADAIVFVNNMPSAGVLHGVTPVAATGECVFEREFHRCSVKRMPEDER
jgi:adenylate kinase family enzyme